MDEISRMEKILRGDPIEPITRLEKFCAKAAGTYTGDPLTPVTRLEWFLDQISGGGGGGYTISKYINKPAAYTGETHYTDNVYNHIVAPDGIAYDEITNTDEEVSYTFFRQDIHHYYSEISDQGQYSARNKTQMYSIVYGPQTNNLSGNSFASNSRLTDVVLKKDGVVTLAATTAFSNTPFASGGTGGTLWVPSARISAYQSATNWVTILGYANNQIKAIEGSVWE